MICSGKQTVIFKLLTPDDTESVKMARVGVENISTTFVDVAALRKLIEPLVQASAPADKWAMYVKEIQPYLAPFDAVISAVHKDGSTDRGTGLVTVH
jgi:hypothetical protein